MQVAVENHSMVMVFKCKIRNNLEQWNRALNPNRSPRPTSQSLVDPFHYSKRCFRTRSASAQIIWMAGTAAHVLLPEGFLFQNAQGAMYEYCTVLVS